MRLYSPREGVVINMVVDSFARILEILLIGDVGVRRHRGSHQLHLDLVSVFAPEQGVVLMSLRHLELQTLLSTYKIKEKYTPMNISYNFLKNCSFFAYINNQ